MLWVVMSFLVTCLLFYCLLAGADFGAGALEFFISPKNRKRHEELVNKAMGPVWEANHIWLIILIVVLFNGFPQVYAQYSIYFHVPLTLMLIGIVFRGCSFSFRNYDAVRDDTHRYYSLAFSLSSLLTPIMFGMIIGGMFFGVDPQAAGYYQKYVAPWLNWPSLAIGIFVLCLFTYLASAYLIGESDDRLVRQYYLRCAQRAGAAALVAGVVVFLFAEKSRHPLLMLFFHNPKSVVCFAAAGVLTLVFRRRMPNADFGEWQIRLMAGAQVGLVLLAWLAVIFPNALFYRHGAPLSLFEAAAPEPTITILAWSLVLGALFFLPILYYLIRVFKIT